MRQKSENSGILNQVDVQIGGVYIVIVSYVNWNI